MGRSEAVTQRRPAMATTNVDTAEAGGVPSWNHLKTFALVGVSSNDYILVVKIVN